MQCSAEYKTIYDIYRKYLLEVNLNSKGLKDAQKEFLLQMSQYMKQGVGLSEVNLTRLSKIITLAYHPDYNPTIDDSFIKKINSISDTTKKIITEGEAKNFEGKTVCGAIDKDLGDIWKDKLITSISSMKALSTGELESKINELIAEYLNKIKEAKSISEMTKLNEEFFKVKNETLQNVKKAYFQANNLNESFDFEVTNNTTLDELLNKLNSAKNRSLTESVSSLENIITNFNELSQGSLKRIAEEIKKRGINGFKEGKISYQEAYSFLMDNLTKLTTNKEIYIDRIKKCDQLKELYADINSLNIKRRLNKLVAGIYFSETFNEEYFELAEDIKLIKERKLHHKILPIVKTNYAKLMLNPQLISITDNKKVTETYNKFLQKAEEYEDGKVGVDSLFVLGELFKDQEKDQRIISYVEGKYTPDEQINPDFVIISQSEFDCQIFYIQDKDPHFSKIFGRNDYDYINISRFGSNKYSELEEVCTLTEFLSHFQVDGSRYSSAYQENTETTVLCNYKGISVENYKYDNGELISFCKKWRSSTEMPKNQECDFPSEEEIENIILSKVTKCATFAMTYDEIMNKSQSSGL